MLPCYKSTNYSKESLELGFDLAKYLKRKPHVCKHWRKVNKNVIQEEYTYLPYMSSFRWF
jgi:hypothetical protein